MHTTATFAEDTALLTVGSTAEESTSKLQFAINKIADWTRLWKLKTNKINSCWFYKKRIQHNILHIDNPEIPFSNKAMYLEMALDVKLHWKEHVKQELYWLICRRSVLSIYNKILIYKEVLKPVLTYELPLWGCTNKNNVKVIQSFQNKVLQTIVNGPWYINLYIYLISSIRAFNSIRFIQILKYYITEI